MVSLSGILEEHVVVLVAVNRAAHFDEEVDVAVAVPITASDAVPFLKVAGAGGAGDVGEPVPPTFLNIRLGTSVARLGSPVPR